MANEIQWRGTETGVTLYATIRSASGTQWNTAGTPNFEAVTAANWADYDIALAESSGNYLYTGTFPAITGNMVAGWYWVDVYKRAGGTPAITDTLQGTIVGYWDGTSLLPWASNAKTVSDKTGYSLMATTGLGNQTANITGNLSGSVGSVTGAVGSVTGAVGSVTAGVTVTTNNDKSGYSLTATTGLGNQTANITGTVSGNSTHSAADVVTALGTGSTLTALATAASQVTIASYIDTEVAAILAAVDTEVAAIKAKTDNLPSDPANQSDVEAAIVALLTTQMTESYNADGTAPTLAQCLFAIMQRLTEFSIAGTTITVKKLDGSTTAFTLAMDSATTPTSSTRST